MTTKPTVADDSANWFKSSYSTGEPNSDCVEVALEPATVHIRDSKNRTGGHLAVPTGAWADFVAYATCR